MQLNIRQVDPLLTIKKIHTEMLRLNLCCAKNADWQSAVVFFGSLCYDSAILFLRYKQPFLNVFNNGFLFFQGPIKFQKQLQMQALSQRVHGEADSEKAPPARSRKYQEFFSMQGLS